MEYPPNSPCRTHLPCGPVLEIALWKVGQSGKRGGRRPQHTGFSYFFTASAAQLANSHGGLSGNRANLRAISRLRQQVFEQTRPGPEEKRGRGKNPSQTLEGNSPQTSAAPRRTESPARQDCLPAKARPLGPPAVPLPAMEGAEVRAANSSRSGAHAR